MIHCAKVPLIQTALVLGVLGLTPAVTAQVTWYVDGHSVVFGPGDGSTASPFRLIQDAINASSDGDTVFIKANTYYESLDLHGREITLEGMDKDLVFLDGTDTTGDGHNETVITCNTGETPATIIQSVTITNGGSIPGRGGGMLVENSSPTVRDCNFVNNSSFSSDGTYLNQGGAIALINSDSLIEDCYFEGNNSGNNGFGAGDGGGVYNENSRTRIIRCVFYDNWVGYGEPGGLGGKGGAILNAGGSDVYIENSRFISNEAGLGGGAIHNAASTCEIVGSGFSWNWSIEGDGGADLWNKSSTVTVTNCTFIQGAVGATALAKNILNDDSHRDITNTILTTQDSVTGILMGDLGTVTGDVTYSYFKGGFSGIGAGDGIISSGILFQGLQGPDGTWGTTDDDFATMPGSITVDAGDSNATIDAGTRSPTGYTLDLEGEDRFNEHCVDNGGIGNPCVDIGAIEVQGNGDIIVPDHYDTIQEAIDEWNDTDYCAGIMVRSGTYTEKIDLLEKAVTLYAETTGGSVLDGEDLWSESPIIYCNEFITPNTVIQGFVITRAWASTGAGMFIQGSPTVRDCSFDRNNAANFGGAVYAQWSASPTFENCDFIDNSAVSFGGGVMTDGVVANATFTDCDFTGNTTDGNGGAIYGRGSIERGSFYNNSASGSGGAVFATDMSVAHSLFVGNVASGAGAISWFDGFGTVEECVFMGNTATGDAGAMSTYRGSAHILNCLFTGNTAGGVGGAMYANGGSPGPVITNTTFSENSDSGTAGVIWVQAGTTTVTNTIMWDNSTPPTGSYSLATLDINYSDIEGGYPTGTGNIDADPQFTDPLGFDGFAGTTDDDLHLLSWSPCLDAGDNNAVPETTPDPLGFVHDLDGLFRVVDAPYTADTGELSPFWNFAVVDMGPYELQVQDCPADTNGDGYLDNGDIFDLITLFLAGDPGADINGDGFLDNGDLISFLEHFLGGC